MISVPGIIFSNVLQKAKVFLLPNHISPEIGTIKKAGNRVMSFGYTKVLKKFITKVMQWFDSNHGILFPERSLNARVSV